MTCPPQVPGVSVGMAAFTFVVSFDPLARVLAGVWSFVVAAGESFVVAAGAETFFLGVGFL